MVSFLFYLMLFVQALRAFSDFPQKLAPLKITHHTVYDAWSIINYMVQLTPGGHNVE